MKYYPVFTLRYFILFFLAALISSEATSQSFHRYSFNRISRANGLVSDDVTAVAQDSSGFIWISTSNGLQRYDGKRFRTFQHNPDDSSTLPPEGIGQIIYDRKFRLWVLTSANKIGIFDTKHFVFRRVNINIEPEFRNNQILTFKEEPDGQIFLLVHKYGLVSLDEKNLQFTREANPIPMLGKNFPQFISRDNTTGDYFVTSVEGFDVFNKKSDSLITREGNSFLSEINSILRNENAFGPVNITQDHKGRIWLNIWSNKRSGPDLLCYDTAVKKWHSYANSVSASAKGYHEFRGILIQKNGDIWIYGTNLFAKLNNETNAFEDVRNEALQSLSVPFEMIYHMYEDKDENIWASANNGLYIFNPEKQFISTFSNKRKDGVEQHFPVDFILETKSGNIFTSIWGLGLFTYDNKFKPIESPILPDKANIALSVWDMVERKNGDFWMGIQGGSIYIFEKKINKLHQFKPRAVEDHTIRQVCEDSSGSMWFGTQSGLLVKCVNSDWRDSTNSFKLIMRMNAHVIKLYTDSKGRIWVGTDRDGLYVIDSQTDKVIEHFTDLEPGNLRLPGIYVSDILQYQDSLFLIASSGLCVLNLERRKMDRISVADGLPSNDIVCITTDHLGNIWLGSQSGPYRMRLGSKMYYTFGAEDGIVFGRRKIAEVTTLKDGRIVFGTSSDLLIVHPDKIKLPDFAPVPQLSDFKVFDKRRSVDSILNNERIVLAYNENSLTIDFTTYTYSNNPVVMYMMEGVDKTWKQAIQNEVSYSYLAPGNYLLKAKSIVASGKESDRYFEMWIEIEPPFWRTWWFYFLLILVGITILYLLDLERMNKLRSNQQLRTDIALNLHDEVNSSLNNINLLSEMALRKADTHTERSKELIVQIRQQSNDLIIAMDDMLWSIDPENDSMDKTLLRMNEFIDALKARHDAKITLNIDPDVVQLKPDMKIRHGIFTIFKDGLRLICQLGGGRDSIINLNLDKNKLMIDMADKVKLNLADLNVTKYLENIRVHADQIKADVDIQTDKDSTRIVLNAPLS
ncbi:ligand-binding sensor domain-containing protein [Pollutibacter soli]|uniref:ligand-binding sensor domain-containing protein n=1 Tax=Pollutibacter soli TaxID=3034157 RepID=UPI0030136523